MTAQQLMNMLEDLDPDTEVRFASQPHWPFEYDIVGVVLASELRREEGGDVGYRPPFSDPNADVLYLIEGSQLGYFTKQAWDCYRRH